MDSWRNSSSIPSVQGGVQSVRPQGPTPSALTSPPPPSFGGSVAPLSSDERAVEILVERSDRVFDTDEMDMDLYSYSPPQGPVGSPVRLHPPSQSPAQPPASPARPSPPSGGLGLFFRASSYSHTTRQVSSQGPSSLRPSPEGSPDVFADAVEYISSPRPRPRGLLAQSNSGRSSPLNASSGSLPPSPTPCPSGRSSLSGSWRPSSHHYYGPGDAPRQSRNPDATRASSTAIQEQDALAAARRLQAMNAARLEEEKRKADERRWRF